MINILSKETVDKIAAGEVVERPLNVVKELMENSIDSGADSVSVEIKDGGVSLIRVTDNGSGIEKEDIPLAFMRHATGKLKNSDDLMHILTYGFRGEALASISGVSQTELITKRREDLYGYVYRIEGGEEKHFEEIGAPDGTSIIVRNLFYNVPARKKFLKTASTESAHIADIVEKTALSRPDISIRLVADGRSLIHTSGNGSLRDVIYTVFGREVSSNLIEINYEGPQLSLSGYIGKPVISRSKRDFEVVFVNNRYIHSSLISGACEEAYKPFMMQHRFPFIMLNVNILPELVDVNVHPQKMEIRFNPDADVYNTVRDVIREALRSSELIVEAAPSVKISREEKVSDNKKERGEKLSLSRAPEPFEVKKAAVMEPPSYYRSETGGSYVQQSLFKEDTVIKEPVPEKKSSDAGATSAACELKDRFISKEAYSEYNIIGQVFGTYWIVEYKDKMYIIDQHAAHEKVLYERRIKELKNKTVQSQNILPPIILELNSVKAQLVSDNIDIFSEFGFEIEREAGNDFIVRAVPSDLYSIAEKNLLMEIIDGLAEEGANASPEILKDRIASMSCKAAVKGHDRLSESEARELLKELLELENPYACPHGRPTVISMSKYELEKKFKRIV